MTSEKYFIIRSCKIKRKYENEVEANRGIDKIVEKNSFKHKKGFVLNSYQCKYCEKWHIGHIKISRINRKKMEDIIIKFVNGEEIIDKKKESSAKDARLKKERKDLFK